jgi:O-antigen ligase
MRWLIILLISVLMLSDLLGMSMSLGPGLSVKNAILYCLAVALLARLILTEQHGTGMPAVLIGFTILIGYAIFSWLAAAFVVRYPGYDVVQSGISLKASLIDPALFFFSAFYALRTSADVKTVLKAFAIVFTVVNAFTLTDVMGLTDFGVRVGTRGAEEGRVFGIFGHANETAGLIVCLLPAIAAIAVSSRGLVRMLWWLAALISLTVLVMTVSRGAFVAGALGTMWAMYMCRRSMPVGLILRGASIAAVSVVLVMIVVGLLDPTIKTILSERLLGQSTALDMDEVSSGRTAIWSAAISKMMDSPLTLITGFGWDMYEHMPFRYATHNYYLGLWFDLGIPGLAVFVFMLAYVIITGRRALDAPRNDLRPYLLGFLFGILPLAIAIFFGDLANPWPYVWIYIGIAMRAAVLTLHRERRAVAPQRPALQGVRGPAVRAEGHAVAMRRPEILHPRQ